MRQSIISGPNPYFTLSAGAGISSWTDKQNLALSINDQIAYNKKILKILNKVKNIDPSAKELVQEETIYIPGYLPSSSLRNYYSEEIWSHKKIKCNLSNKSNNLSMHSPYTAGDVYCLDVYLEFRVDDINVKIFGCSNQPVLHVYNGACYVSYMDKLELFNKNLNKKISRQLVAIITKSKFPVAEDSELSNEMKKYLSFY